MPNVMISVGSQSLQDKLNALKCIVSGQGLSFVVLKATTGELMGPKKKHLAYLTNVTNEPNVSIPNLVKYLMQRARNQEWSVVFKSLMAIHYLISYGNEKFIQNLASSTINQKYLEQLSSFSDKSSNRAYDMSTFIRRYSRYIAAKVDAYKSLGLDFCRTPSIGNNNLIIKTTSNSPNDNLDPNNNQDLPPTQLMKQIPQDRLMAILPILQDSFDLLMAFDASVKDLNNGIINSAFSMLYKDFVKLYISYQSAIIRLLEFYFASKVAKQANEMLDAYRKFLVRMDKVSDFMFVVDAVGMDKSDMPNVSRSPNLSLKLMEKHLENLTSANSSSSTLKRQSASTLPRGQSTEVAPVRIDFDYGTYNSRRLQSLRRTNTTTTTTSPTKLALQFSPKGRQEADLYARIGDKLFENATTARKIEPVHDNKTNSVIEATCDEFGSSRVSALIREEPEEQEERNSDRKSLLLMGDSEELEGPSAGKEESKLMGPASLPSDWIRVDL